MNKKICGLFREGYGDFVRGDIPSLLSKFAGDMEWVISGPRENPLAGERCWVDQVAQHFKLPSQLVEFSVFEPEEFIGKSDRNVVLGKYAGRVKPTGRTFQSEWAMGFLPRGGKCESQGAQR